MVVDIAIIVPVFNEAANVLLLAREVRDAFRNCSLAYELVFVDDGSTDDTWQQLRAAHQSDSRVRVLRHLRNAGQSAAIWTGIQATSSPILATLDGDLQNPPGDLLKLAEYLEKAEMDFVSGVRTNRQDGFTRRASSVIARLARRLVLRADFQDLGCAARVFKRTALKGICPFDGLHRFLPILVSLNGGKTLEVPINHRPRVAGVSKYGIRNRLGRGILDLFALAWHQRRRLPAVQVQTLEDEVPTLTAYSGHPSNASETRAVPVKPTVQSRSMETRAGCRPS